MKIQSGTILLNAISLVLCVFSTCVSSAKSGSGSDAQKSGSGQNPVSGSLSLQELILVLMAKHGQSQTASAFNSLDNRELGEVMRILLVAVDKPLAADIEEMQKYAQTADKELVAVIARIVTGDGTVAKDIFTWDEKLRKFQWWMRIRQRMFLNMDKYIGSYKAQLDSQKSKKVAS